MQSSLADLNTRLREQLPMDRFRPNIVIDESGEPWAEDGWHSLALAGPPSRRVEFVSLKPCSRCKVRAADRQNDHNPQGASMSPHHLCNEA
jgi:uncharacterized protein YcbX